MLCLLNLLHLLCCLLLLAGGCFGFHLLGLRLLGFHFFRDFLFLVTLCLDHFLHLVFGFLQLLLLLFQLLLQLLLFAVGLGMFHTLLNNFNNFFCVCCLFLGRVHLFLIGFYLLK